MPKVGNRTYPDKSAAIARDNNLAKVFGAYANKCGKDAQAAAAYVLLDDIKPLQRYKMFFSSKARMSVSLPPKLTEILKKYAREDFKKNEADIIKIMEVPKKECFRILDAEVKGFYTTKEFLDYHCYQVTGISTFGGLLLTAKDKLKLKKLNSLVDMQEVIREGLYGNKQKAKTMAQKLSKTGKFGVLGNRDIYKEMEKHKFVC